MQNIFVPGEGLAGPPSFMNVPIAANAIGSKAFVVGIPFDCGIHATRVGARQGLNHIRRN